MILDVTNQLANLYAPTATGNNIQTASVLDRMVAMEDGAGADIGILVQVFQAVTSGGAATVDFQLLGNATDPNFGSGNVVVYDFGAIAKATLVAGYKLKAKIPRQAVAGSYELKSSFLRYLALNVNIGTAVLTAGQFSAWLLPDGFQDSIAYAAGFSI